MPLQATANSYPHNTLHQVAEAGLETTPKTPGKTGFSETGGAESGAFTPVLHEIAADLRKQLTFEECVRLASLLTESGDS